MRDEHQLRGKKVKREVYGGRMVQPEKKKNGEKKEEGKVKERESEVMRLNVHV